MLNPCRLSMMGVFHEGVEVPHNPHCPPGLPIRQMMKLGLRGSLFPCIHELSLEPLRFSSPGCGYSSQSAAPSAPARPGPAMSSPCPGSVCFCPALTLNFQPQPASVIGLSGDLGTHHKEDAWCLEMCISEDPRSRKPRKRRTR